MDHRPDVQETVVYKCPFDPHKLPPMSKEQARVPPTVDKLMEAEAKQKNPYKKPTKKVSHRCGSKTPVWYTKNGSKRYRCK
jgi:hypothetical protein